LREIGNILIFLQMLEKVLHRKADFTFNYIAFFSAMRAHPRDNKKEEQAAQETPFLQNNEKHFLTICKDALTKAKSIPDLQVDAKHIDALLSSCEKAAEVHKYTGTPQESLFTSVLMTLKSSVNKNVREEWLGNAPSEGHIIEIETPADFARLFSAILFIFCKEPAVTPELEGNLVLDDLEAFGVGFLWGGCTILHLLGVQRRFMMLDFSYHILKLDRLEPIPRSDPKVKKKKVEEDDSKKSTTFLSFLRNAAWCKRSNEQIFICLESYLPSGEAKFEAIDPPLKDHLDKHKVIRSGLQHLKKVQEAHNVRDSTSVPGSMSPQVSEYDNPALEDDNAESSLPSSVALDPNSSVSFSQPPPISPSESFADPNIDPSATFGDPPPRPT